MSQSQPSRSAIRQFGEQDDIDALQQRCLAFIDSVSGKTPHKAFAKTKLSEMVYHLRRHREDVALARGSNE